MQVHVGDAEVLLDDSVRYAASVHAAGGKAELHLWEQMPHVFVSSPQELQAARHALDLSAAFLTHHLLA
ncbi:hypothetical protein EU557_10215 [Hymenobacter wooponensis]|uniref:Alpha/beta hydrolase fold-3 domain-containing protein n=1 Tax=Hymenobacter wooponensis TaxID=1525360 RepID=A0A4Z0MKA7_9BACT|nr:hypothetical protein EU557_10215 [Hymenobacter wooponensis]